MANHALEEKVRKLSADYIYKEAVSSLLLLLLSVTEDETNSEEPFHYEIHPNILEIKKAIRHYIVQAKDILNDDDQLRLSALEDCMDLKKEILSIYENIYGYFSVWNTYSTLVGDEVALRKYREEAMTDKKIEWDLFYMDCKEFLNSANTVLEQKNLMGQLLKCIPLKMAREKYFDILKESLNLAFSGESEEFISASLRAFESFCAPQHFREYGKYFPEIAQWLASKKTLHPENMSDEELNEEYTDFNSVFDDLNRIEEYFTCIFNDINALIILFSLSFSFDDLTEEDVAYADLYHTVCEFLTGELSEIDKAAYLETLNASLEEAVEPVIDKANSLGKEELKLMKQVKSFDEFEDNTKKILLTEDFIRSCYYGDLNDDLFHFDIEEDLPPTDEGFKAHKFDAFIHMVWEHFEQLPVRTRRIAMQQLLGALPPIFTAPQLLEMIENMVESTSEVEQKILLVDKVGTIFADNGFHTIDPTDEDLDITHDHHNHGDDCDCGCEHHHH